MKAVFQWDLELKASDNINHQASRQFKVPIMSTIILGTVNIISDEICSVASASRNSQQVFVCFVCMRGC